MKKLTDEMVAKALGYKPVHVGNSFNEKTRKHEKCIDWRHPKRPHPDSETWGIPNFTTSLDAIVGEIEANGLLWEVGYGECRPWKSATILHEKFGRDVMRQAKTAPLALCHALLAYLKADGGKP